jgi:hypothetical protein
MPWEDPETGPKMAASSFDPDSKDRNALQHEVMRALAESQSPGCTDARPPRLVRGNAATWQTPS